MRYQLLGHRLHRSSIKGKLVVASTTILLFIICLLASNKKPNPFLLHHSPESPYNRIITVLFNLMKNPEHLKTHELTENLFTHEFVPFRNINNELVLNQINNHTPYDMNPNLYWAILLEQISHKSDGVVFSWYDFVDNKQYNNLLRLHHSQSDKVKISCKTINFKILPKDILAVDEHFYDDVNITIPETLKTKGLFTKDLVGRYQATSFLLKNSNRNYDPHQVCIDQSHKLNPIHKKSKDNLKNVDYYLSPFLQFELKSEVRGEVYGLQASSYVVNNQPNPLGLIMLKFFDYTQEVYKSGFKYYEIEANPLHDKNHGYRPLMGENYDTLSVYEKYKNSISLDQQTLLSKFNALGFESHGKEHFHPMKLSRDQFLFNIKENIKRLENAKSLTKTQQNYLDSLKYHSKIHYSQSIKHLDEASGILQFANKGSHYDYLFFHTQRHEENLEMKQAGIHNLLLTLENLVQGMGLSGWISHGNLFSYSYNGQNFPWDEDVDYQMPIRDLHKLAELANNTVILQDPRYGNGKYFLRMGNLLERVHGNGKNNIDARLIDVDTGLYIDITGLSYNGDFVSERDYTTLFDFFKNNEHNVKKWLTESKDYVDNSTSDIDKLDATLYMNKLQRDTSMDNIERQAMIKNCKQTIAKEKIGKQEVYDKAEHTVLDYPEEKKYRDLIHNYLYDWTHQQRFYFNLKMDLVTCKNKHFTNISDLAVMNPTFFQRIPVYVPANYYKLLIKEYRSILRVNSVHDALLQFKRYVFIPRLKTWLDKQTALNFMNFPHKIMNDADYSDEDNCINLSNESLGNLDLELSELLLVNMCDMNGQNFDTLMTVSNLISQFDQKNYRYKELKYELSDNLDIDDYLVSHIGELKKTSDFHIDPYYLNHLYEEYYEKDRPYEKDVCLKHVFRAVQYLEDTYNDLQI